MKTQVMGVLNITPDSFYDGGKYINPENAIIQAKKLINDGASIIDIGGESSKPYAKKVSLKEELSRIIPIVKEIKKQNPQIKISIDTYKADVMAQSIDLGVDMINDIYSLSQPNTTEVIASSNCDICLMHMQGTPQTMQNNPQYKNIVAEVLKFFENKINYCINNNIAANRIILDVGFGFGKTYEHNLELINNLDKFKGFGLRLLVGISNKSIFDKILNGREVEKRVTASTAFNQIAITKGANIIRTHNPLETSDMIKVVEAIENGL